MEKLFEVIFEDEDLLVINKPAGLVCHPTKGDVYSSLISRVRLHLGKKGEPHLVNRLDRETSGVVMIAKTAVAALDLRRLWESRSVRKEYLAIVHGHLEMEEGMIDFALGKDIGSRVAIKDCVRPDGAPSQTQFRIESRFSRAEGKFSFLRLRPLTGRKHQIRIHLAEYGHPLVGDKLYGGDEDIYLALVEGRLAEEQKRKLILPHQALHAHRISFLWRNREHIFSAEPELWFAEFLEGGTEEWASGKLGG